jgi:hypothetical protein
MNLIRTANKESKQSRYEQFNFTRNPFPRKPGISINSSDDRENGNIYLPELRAEEIQQFKNLLIPKPNSHEAKNICFLMDHATRQGRGIGKTSFLNFQKNCINKDLGDEISQGAEVIFSVYCSPIPGENYKKFYLISKLIIQSLIEQKIIATAICRLRALTGLFDERIFQDVTDSNIVDTIGNINWIREAYAKIGLDNWPSDHQIDDEVKKILRSEIQNIQLIDRLSRFGTSPTETVKFYFSSFTESDWRKNANTLLFNDLIKLFDLAKISKGLILFDELEKVIMPQNSQDRRSFCEELRYWFLDGTNENAKDSFFNILLVIHPYIQEILNPHWNASGLERFASLGGQFSGDYTIFFKPIENEQALPLSIEYMKRSRVASHNKSDIFPFEEDALQFALQKTFNVPGKFLSFLHLSIEKAIDEQWESITKDRIERLLIESSVNSSITDEFDGEEEMTKPKINI